MRIYIPEKDMVANLEIEDGERKDITAQYITGVKNSGLYKVPPEIRERLGVEYMMYRDDYNEWAGIVDKLCVIISRVYQRGDESPIAYETVINPQGILEASVN
jgi:hypothetical protein